MKKIRKIRKIKCVICNVEVELEKKEFLHISQMIKNPGIVYVCAICKFKDILQDGDYLLEQEIEALKYDLSIYLTQKEEEIEHLSDNLQQVQSVITELNDSLSTLQKHNGQSHDHHIHQGHKIHVQRHSSSHKIQGQYKAPSVNLDSIAFSIYKFELTHKCAMIKIIDFERVFLSWIFHRPYSKVKIISVESYYHMNCNKFKRHVESLYNCNFFMANIIHNLRKQDLKVKAKPKVKIKTASNLRMLFCYQNSNISTILTQRSKGKPKIKIKNKPPVQKQSTM